MRTDEGRLYRYNSFEGGAAMAASFLIRPFEPPSPKGEGFFIILPLPPIFPRCCPLHLLE